MFAQWQCVLSLASKHRYNSQIIKLWTLVVKGKTTVNNNNNLEVVRIQSTSCKFNGRKTISKPVFGKFFLLKEFLLLLMECWSTMASVFYCIMRKQRSAKVCWRLLIKIRGKVYSALAVLNVYSFILFLIIFIIRQINRRTGQRNRNKEEANNTEHYFKVSKV